VRRTLALYGGTFDPPHVAHAMAVHWLLMQDGIDGVLVVPAAQHAFGKSPVASFDDRLAMARLMVAHLDPARVEVLDIEGRREGTSYTIDTVREILAARPGVELRLAIGSDNLTDLPKWRESEELLRLAPPVVVPRIVSPADVRPGALPMVSSTFVREALAGRRDTGGLVPANVMDYIRRHGLYEQA